MEPFAFAEALIQFASSNVLNSYQTYFTSMPSREKALKDYLLLNKRFLAYHDMCSQLPEFQRQSLQDLLIAPVQRVTRYPLLLKEIIGHATDEALHEMLQKSLEKFEATTRHLNNVKARAEQTEKLFVVQREVYNFPPEFLKVGRRVLGGIECILTDINLEKSSKKHFQLYLCNDLAIFTRKRDCLPSEGIKNDFIFAIDLRHIQLNSVRGRNLESTSFTVNVDLERACFTNDVAEIEHLSLSRSFGTESQSFGTSYHFVPLDCKQLRAFLTQFHEARNQYLLGESPAALRLHRENDREIYIHQFRLEDFLSWSHRSPIAIIFTEDADSEDTIKHLDKFDDYNSVAIVQCRANGYRFCIRSKFARKLSDEIFIPRSEMLPLPVFMKSFYSAIINAHIQYSVYPPYDKQIQQQIRFVLENAVGSTKAFSRGNGTIKGFISNLLHRSESQKAAAAADRLSRGSSIKSSPLASPSKPVLKKELNEHIRLDAALSNLHL